MPERLSLEDRKIPAHRVRHDFALIGAATTETGSIGLGIAGRVDTGAAIKGKKLTHFFGSRRALKHFTRLTGLGGTETLEAYVEYLNERGPEIRFSARVLKTIEVWRDAAGEWIEAQTAPESPAKFRYKYALADFEEPRRETELYLAESFWERRQRNAQTRR